MSALPAILGSTTEVVPEISEEQRKSKVYRHPLRNEIHTLLHAGKSASWISYYIEEQFPLEEPNPDDPDGDPIRHPDYRRNRRLQLSARVIDRYRERFMPEVAPGVDIVSEDVEDLVGRVFPPPSNVPWELDAMAVHIRAQEQMFAEQREKDADMDMGVSETSVNLSSTIMQSLDMRLSAARSLARPGYEPAVERQQIDLDHQVRSQSIELHGRIGPDGNPIPVDSTKVDVMMKLLAEGPDALSALVSEAQKAAAAITEAQVVEEEESTGGNPTDGPAG